MPTRVIISVNEGKNPFTNQTYSNVVNNNAPITKTKESIDYIDKIAIVDAKIESEKNNRNRQISDLGEMVLSNKSKLDKMPAPDEPKDPFDPTPKPREDELKK